MNTKYPIDDDPEWTAWLLGELDERKSEQWRAAVDAHPCHQEQEQEQRLWLEQFSRLLAVPSDVSLHQVQRQLIRQVAREAYLSSSGAALDRTLLGRGGWRRWAATGLAALLVLSIGLLWRNMRENAGTSQGSGIAGRSGQDASADFAPAAQAAATPLAPLRRDDEAISGRNSFPDAQVAGWHGVPDTLSLPWVKDAGAWRAFEEKFIVASEQALLADFLPSPRHAAALLNDCSFARELSLGGNEIWQGLRVRAEQMSGEAGRQWLALGLCNASERNIDVAAELRSADRTHAADWQWRGCGWPEPQAANAARQDGSVPSNRANPLHPLTLHAGEQATLLLELQPREGAADLEHREPLDLELCLRVGGQQRNWPIKVGAATKPTTDVSPASAEMQHLVLVWQFAEWMRSRGSRPSASSWLTACQTLQRSDENGERRRARSVMLRAWAQAVE